MSNFDADALERAAKAVREMEKSRNVKAYMEISKREHTRVMAEENRKSAEAKAQQAMFAKEQEKIRWEEQRRTIEATRKQQEQLEVFKSEEARKRGEEEHQKARRRNAELIEMQKKAEAEREALRRATEADIQAERRRTDEHRAALDRENMKARALAEAEGRIKEQRENEEVYTRRLRVKGEEERKRVVEGIETFFSSLGTSLSNFVRDKSSITTSVVSFVALAAGIYSVREGARIAGRVIERRLNVPSLVRETSRTNNHFSPWKRLQRAVTGGTSEGATFNDVVLEEVVQDRVRSVAVATKNTRRNGAPFRHMLFYGPPGTGKTMVAKRLARTSGMDYAIMTGGDVGPLGRDAVTELHKLFDWSESTSRGLLLFIDEADAFLSSRSRTQMSEDQRNALNALLYRTGDTSQHFMLVLATNRPGDLDSAIADRVDEAMVFDLPGLAEREMLVRLYFEKYLVKAGSEAKGFMGMGGKASARIRVEDVDEEYLKDIAARTDGFSGRGISKLMISVQGAVYGSAQPVLTRDMMEDVVQWKIKEHEDKVHFRSYHYGEADRVVDVTDVTEDSKKED